MSPSVDQVSEYLSTLFGMLGQGADAQLDAADLVEVLDQRVRRDADEARGEPALRHERAARTLGQRAHGTCHGHVFGQVEVVRVDLACDLRDLDVAVEGQARNDRIGRIVPQVPLERGRVLGVELVGVQTGQGMCGDDGAGGRRR